MKVLIKETLSPHKFKDGNGYLICTDCILARTGKQTYRKDEVFTTDDSSEIDVDRPYEEVFDSKTLASFENVPLCKDHPNEDVTPENYNSYSVGFVRNIRQGKDSGLDVIIGDLVITDGDVIKLVEDGEYCELSCGYNTDIIGDDKKGYKQTNIRGNHVALCECGRAGNARIVDSIKDNKLEEVIKFLKQNLFEFDIYQNKINFESNEEMKNATELLRKYGYNYNIYNSNSITIHDSQIISYKGFIFDNYNNDAPLFIGFTKDKEVQEINGHFIAYVKNGSHGDLYNIVKNVYGAEAFTVIVEPGKITITKLKKYSQYGVDLVKAAKQIENTNNIIWDSIKDDYFTSLPDRVKKSEFNDLYYKIREKTENKWNYRVSTYGDKFKIEIDKAVGAAPGTYGPVGGEWKTIKTIYSIEDSIKDNLIQSGSKEAFKKNVETEIEAGKDPKQALAIAYSIQRENDSDEVVKDELYSLQELNQMRIGNYKESDIYKVNGKYSTNPNTSKERFNSLEEVKKYIDNKYSRDSLASTNEEVTKSLEKNLKNFKDSEFKKGDKVKISNDFHILPLRGAEGIVEYIDDYINIKFINGPQKGETHPYSAKNLIKDSKPDLIKIFNIAKKLSGK